MAKILLFLSPQPFDKTAPFKIAGPHVDMTRVPNVGEILHLGADQHGISADYEVVLVVHAPFRPSDTDAEVYAKRVNISKAVQSAKARETFVPNEPIWEKDAWPEYARDHTEAKKKSPASASPTTKQAPATTPATKKTASGRGSGKPN
jgi:hypothetical protein